LILAIIENYTINLLEEIIIPTYRKIIILLNKNFKINYISEKKYVRYITISNILQNMLIKLNTLLSFGYKYLNKIFKIYFISTIKYVYVIILHIYAILI